MDQFKSVPRLGQWQARITEGEEHARDVVAAAMRECLIHKQFKAAPGAEPLVQHILDPRIGDLTV